MSEENIIIEELSKRIKESVSPFHTVRYVADELKAAGYEEICLGERWKLKAGGKYLVKIYDSTVAAFSIGEKWDGKNLRMAMAHTDFPCIKLKPSAQIIVNNYVKCNAEVYGGAILNTWLDRPLSAAGRVVVKSDNIMEPEIKLIDFKEPLFIIPNLAIHMNRDVNKGVELNRQKDMLPVIATLSDIQSETDEKKKTDYILNAIAKAAGTEVSDILNYDLFVYPVEEPSYIGLEKCMFSAGRLDNITSVQACVHAIKDSYREDGLNMIVLYDSEEVGSGTKQGAGSMAARSVLKRIYQNFGFDNEDFECAVANAMGLSVDVAHAIHPNSPEKSDITNKLYMNKGFAIKTSASERYASDLKVLGAVMQLCRSYGIKCQRYVNRSDMAGGSTLGAIAVENMPIRMLDIGVPILAMHSARETMGVHDQLYIENVLARFMSEV
ncbi:MAG: M18 family aminopeptidase [Lachnospiraceae bacterium]|nr:M18 family aminopeptidase [Lachnospiraceae bacterium]